MTLFDTGSYQRVISRTKQFRVVDMGDDEMDELLNRSYFMLSQEHFKQGDVVRALRDIETLIERSPNDAYRVVKLKYLCYLENFESATAYAQELLDSIKGA